MIIIDYSGIAISTIFSMKIAITENDLRHMILNSIRMYNARYRRDYGSVVIACDGGSWRKTAYPYYKAQRAKGREDSGKDWEEMYRILNLIRDELIEFFPYKVVQVKGAEADDIIATLVETTQEFGQHEPVMIISADHDFMQLQKYSNVKQFSPMTKKLIKVDNPLLVLREKILRGDGGDGVPNVLSPDDCFVTGQRQKTLHAKKIKEWTDNWDVLVNKMDTFEYAHFLRNQKMIDLSFCPQDIKEQIINNYKVAPTKSNILSYLINKRCSHLIECASEFN